MVERVDIGESPALRSGIAIATTPGMRTMLAVGKQTRKIVLDPVASASAAGLRYVSDADPGFRRQRARSEFRYYDEQGRLIRDAGRVHRIQALAIPPAWRDVWICPSPEDHLQATGRDDKGRKQYRYHERWRAVRDDTKYGRLIAFGKMLPKIRRATARDLRLPGLPRRKVLATIVRLLQTTLIRVGNEEYARKNRSYGLTTMCDRHLAVEGTTLKFAFQGKSGIRHEIDLKDRRLAKIVNRCQDLPGQQLFQFVDDEGSVHDVDSADVNEYIREVTGREFTAKDFRTWVGTVLAAMALQEFAIFDSQAQAKRNLTQAIEHVAERLGNTPAICRKCYVHPDVINAYLDGSLLETLRQRAAQEMKQSLHSLQPAETAVLALLQRRLAREQDKSQKTRLGGTRRNGDS
jgi:DNA topoisomerase I